MEVCSDDEDNVIEVNVVPMVRKILPPPPILPSHPLPPLPPRLPGFPPPRPPPFFPQQPLPPRGPAQFLSHRPPPQIFPPHPRPPPPPPTILPGFKSPPAPRPPFIHPPNGFMDNFVPSPRLLPSSRSAGKIKRNLVPPPKDKRDSIGRDVMYKALEQLRKILMNDVQKKLVERYAYRALENFWEKMENVRHVSLQCLWMETVT